MAGGSGFVQQRPKMSKANLREEIAFILSNMVPETSNGPSTSMLRKADTALDEIMRAVEKYES